MMSQGCDFAGCPEDHHAKGYCKSHYAIFMRTGEAFSPGRTGPKEVDHPEWTINRLRELVEANSKVTISKAAEELGVSRQLCYDLIRRYELPWTGGRNDRVER